MEGAPCCFSASCAGRPAQPSPGHTRALFCGELGRLQDVLHGPGGKALVLRMLCAARRPTKLRYIRARRRISFSAQALRRRGSNTYEKALARLGACEGTCLTLFRGIRAVRRRREIVAQSRPEDLQFAGVEIDLQDTVGRQLDGTAGP